MKYYMLSGEASGPWGIAYAPEGTSLFLLPKSGIVQDWQALGLDLKEGDFADNLPNNCGLRLYSGKLKTILDALKTENDELQWVDVAVKSESGEVRNYHALHFVSPPNVIDKKKSMFAPNGSIIRPVLDAKLAAKHNVFAYETKSGIGVDVSEVVRKKVRAEKCTNVVFEKLRVA